jgi:hypothetical protein
MFRRVAVASKVERFLILVVGLLCNCLVRKGGLKRAQVANCVRCSPNFCRPYGTRLQFCGITPDLRPGYRMPPLRGWGVVISSFVVPEAVCQPRTRLFSGLPRGKRASRPLPHGLCRSPQFTLANEGVGRA